MTPKITVILLATENITNTAFFYERLGVKKEKIESQFVDREQEPQYRWKIHDVPVKFYVAVSNTNNGQELIAYYKDRAEEIFDFTKEQHTKGGIYNEMVRAAYTDYVCIVNERAILEKNWLASLLFYSENTFSTAAAFVPHSLDNSTIVSILDRQSEGWVRVFKPHDEQPIPDKTACIMERQLFYLVGAFTQEPQLQNCVLEHWCKRAAYLGRPSFYIPDRFAITFVQENLIDFEALNKSIEDMKKVNNLYIAL